MRSMCLIEVSLDSVVPLPLRGRIEKRFTLSTGLRFASPVATSRGPDGAEERLFHGLFARYDDANLRGCEFILFLTRKRDFLCYFDSCAQV